MGLFGNHYERAGSGIAKNAPKKKGIFRFFEIFGRKFWKLFELNLLYFLSFLPVIGAVALFFAVDSQLGTILAAACLVLFAVIIGPATAAHTKILKNFIMEKPTFLAHEFFHTFRTEFKHACIVGVLDCVLACCISAAFYVYPRLIEQTGSKMFYVLFAITLSIGVIALLMNFYIFPMLVSTNLSLKNVLKNSLALSVVALKTNIITILVLAAVIAFVALPTIARQTNGKTEIVRITQPVLKGEKITSDNAEVVEVGGYNLPSNVAHSMEDVEGLYVTADLAAGDYILTSKVSTVPVSSDVALNDIPSGKVAISLTVKTLASGLSDKLQPGDIIRIYHFLETAEEVPELRFVKVLSVTDSDGINVDNTKEPTEDEEPQQSATITVLASPEQARIITEMENDGVAHVALISRNNDQLAEELLAEQDKTLQEIYFPETLVEENAESQDGGETAEGAADSESTGEAGTENTEGGVETTPADSIPEDGE